jgi:mannose-6-phosphate isomerase-like protein (cupin superfamily)
MHPPLKFQDQRRFEHMGEELMFVLSGTVEVELSGRAVRLRPGDALYFDAHLPHRSRSVGPKNAQVLVIVAQV